MFTAASKFRLPLAVCAALASHLLPAGTGQDPRAPAQSHPAAALTAPVWLMQTPDWTARDNPLFAPARLLSWLGPAHVAPPAVARATNLSKRPPPIDYAALLAEDITRRPRRPAISPLRDAVLVEPHVPDYEHWLNRLGRSRRPARADDHLMIARAAFAAEGVPSELVWLAETESSFNPLAVSPVGARGLFQLMPATARSLGLSTTPLDQRTDPEASAAAAAAYLRHLHNRFGDWALALAAYNAGEGLVSRALRAEQTDNFAAIATRLPKETLAYVPRVLATVRIRTGLGPGELDHPRPRLARPAP